ncbi:MAG TPA: LamG-like jellyroll fold domain-containing protein [Ignavibacteriaceae bacterium]|nr:LamG-like jellyroll fold domain-containing protein [Ignavibacteriaceae bacterium]
MKLQLHLLIALIFIIFFSKVFPQVNLDSGLVAYYPFNGNAIDESGNGFNGTVFGATLTSDRFNRADKAYNFIYDGFSSDKIQVSGTSGLNFSTGGFSLSAWIKFSGSAGPGNNYPIVSKHICGEQSGFILMLYNGKLTFWLAGSSGYNILSTNEDYTDEMWHQVVAVYDESNQFIYVDGVLKNSVAFNYSVINSADWALGGYNGCNGGFNGKVDEVKIYNRPLSTAEILDDFNLTKNSLVVFLPLNGNTIDMSGNGHDGTINGNAVLTTDRFNLEDRAFTFPDQTSNISLANSTSLNLENGFTINTWIKYKNIYAVIVGKHICGFVNGFVLGIDYDGQIQLWLGNSGWATVRTNKTYIEDNWYMVSATYDGISGNAKIYIDGELEGTGNVPYTNFSSYPITIGEVFQNNCQPANMSGAVDEVKIYNRPLSDEEIEMEYNISSAGLVAYFPFNGNVNDESGNMNNGVNYNASFAMDRYGIDNSSLFFATGVESYVEGMNPGNNLPVGNSPRTFSAWINTGFYNQYGSNIFHYGTQEAAPTNMHFLITDVLGLGNGYGFGVVYGNQNVVDGIWHFVAGVYEGGTERITKLYVDGKLDASGTISTEPNTTLGTNWRIGRFMAGSANFQGFLDEVRVYNAALTQQEIWDLYQSSTTAPNLIAPVNNSTINTLTPVLEWDSLITAFDYRLEIARDSIFTNSLLYQVVPQKTFQVPAGLLSSDSTYYWRVRTATNGGVGPWSEVFSFDIVITDVEDEQQIPREFALLQNYPNPFNPSTSIKYQVSSKSQVSLKVYDVLGNEVATLVNEERKAGSYEVEFDAAGLSSGVYFYQLKAGNYIETKKMILIK